MADADNSAGGITLLMVRLFRHVSQRRRFQFLLLLALTLISTFAEVISLGAVVPFIGILTQPEKVFALPAMAGPIRYFAITSADQLVLPLTIGFAAAALLAGGFRLVLLWTSIRVGNATGIDLGIEIYRRTLFQPYEVHVARSSSEVISGITQKIGTVIGVLISMVTVFTSAVMFMAILATMLSINAMVAGAAIVGFGFSYGVIAWLTRHRLLRNGKVIAYELTHVVQTLQEGLGAIRDVLLDGTQDVYSEAYGKSIRRLHGAVGENTYINQAPRFAMETLGMVLIAGLAFYLSHEPGGVGAALPLLAALAFGAQRLLPLLQQMYAHWTVARGSHSALADVIELLGQPLPDEADLPSPAPLDFRDSIEFENVSFRYGKTGPYVLEQVNFKIPKGSRIGFVGRTGSGKSTVLDLLMTLLHPTQGRILVDGRPVDNQYRRAWQRTIAHVPQDIYMADATIAENIAFGIPYDRIDHERVRYAARQAQIADFIESGPEGYLARVGERGVRLSGGQRQRIGIARALYKQAKVLIFDEATSALDNSTEAAVMSAIEGLDRDLTLLIIAHRVSTLERSDTIIQLEDGRVVAQGTYNELLRTGTVFNGPEDSELSELPGSKVHSTFCEEKIK